MFSISSLAVYKYLKLIPGTPSINFDIVKRLMCGSCHIQIVLLGVKYQNRRQTLDDYLHFDILLRQIHQKLNCELVVYKLASL